MSRAADQRAALGPAHQVTGAARSVLQAAGREPATPMSDPALAPAVAGVDPEDLDGEDAAWPDDGLDQPSPAARPEGEVDLLQPPSAADEALERDGSFSAETDDPDFALFDLSDLETQEIWQFREISPGGSDERERGARPSAVAPPRPAQKIAAAPPPAPAPPTAPSPPRADPPRPPTPAAPPGTGAPATKSDHPLTPPVRPVAAAGPPLPPGGNAPASPTASICVPPGVAPEAVRVLDDLKKLGVQGASETLEGLYGRSDKPAATERQAPPPAAAAPPPVARPPARDQAPPPPPPAPTAGRRPWPKPGRVLAAALLLTDRPFRGLSPRVKDFLGQLAISMALTAAFLTILNGLGLLPR